MNCYINKERPKLVWSGIILHPRLLFGVGLVECFNQVVQGEGEGVFGMVARQMLGQVDPIGED